MRRLMGTAAAVVIAVVGFSGCGKEGPMKPGATSQNTIGMTLVRVPAGSFMMGSPDTEASAGADERPAHRMQISRPFEISMTEVTVAQFREFVSATSYLTAAERDAGGGWMREPGSTQPRQVRRCSWKNPGFEQFDEYPVVEVGWADAVAFCAWLSEKESRVYRLPTEAEWEYAHRSGTQTAYSCGDDPAGLQAVANVADRSQRGVISAPVIAPWKDEHPFTSPVGRLAANSVGLRDTHGNVREWCADWYDAQYYQQSPGKDARGPAEGTLRVTRGGSWFDGVEPQRSARRMGADLPFSQWTGFRVVREV